MNRSTESDDKSADKSATMSANKGADKSTDMSFEISGDKNTDIWGEHHLRLHEALAINLGTLNGSLVRRPREWDLEYRYDQDRYVTNSTGIVSRVRTAMDNDVETAHIAPASANRNVVVRPIQTVQIPSGRRVTMFISTPLWLQCRVGETMIADLPLQILSDTWFGQNTREGELCYSNETQARMNRDDLPTRPERLVTPVSLVNDGDDVLVFNRLSLPVPYLSIYRSEDAMWTQEVIITRTSALDVADIQVDALAPEQHVTSELISGPRSSEDPNLLRRTLGRLFD